MIRPVELAGIKAGTVDLGFRRWDRPRVVVGTRMRTAVGLIEVTSVEPVDESTITDDHARTVPAPEAEIDGPGPDPGELDRTDHHAAQAMRCYHAAPRGAGGARSHRTSRGAAVRPRRLTADHAGSRRGPRRTRLTRRLRRA